MHGPHEVLLFATGFIVHSEAGGACLKLVGVLLATANAWSQMSVSDSLPAVPITEYHR